MHFLLALSISEQKLDRNCPCLWMIPTEGFQTLGECGGKCYIGFSQAFDLSISKHVVIKLDVLCPQLQALLLMQSTVP